MHFVAALWALAIVAGAPCRAVAASDPTVRPSETGAQLYARYCQLCHGAHLEGYAADNAPSLASPTFRESASDAFLRAAIERGRAGTAMAGYARTVGGPLAPVEVNALIAYIRAGTRPRALPRKHVAGDAKRGAATYAARCQGCHGTPEQRGTAVHLANAMFLDAASDAFLRDAIARGRPGTPMAAWNDTLSAQEIDDVVAYVRSLARPVAPPPAVAEGSADVRSIENVPIVVNPTGAQADFTMRDDRYVSVADVAKAYDEKRRLVIVDARTTSDYLRMHIAGAISIPYFNMHNLDLIPNDGTWVIAYCACPHHVSGVVVDELRKRGYAHSAVLDEGVFLWQQQGHPVVAAPGQPPVPAPPPNAPPWAMPPTLEDPIEPPH